jgi:hypothetical protein
MNATETNADGMTLDEIASKIRFYKTAFWPRRNCYVGIIGTITSDLTGLVGVVVRCTGQEDIAEPMELCEYCL